MKEREDDFLKSVFDAYQPNESLGHEFNQNVFHQIAIREGNTELIRNFLKIFIPILIICMTLFATLLYFYGESIFSFLQEVVPMLRPWHFSLVIGIFYFHFARSLLFLAFIYLKKQFNFAFPKLSMMW